MVLHCISIYNILTHPLRVTPRPTVWKLINIVTYMCPSIWDGVLQRDSLNCCSDVVSISALFHVGTYRTQLGGSWDGTLCNSTWECTVIHFPQRGQGEGVQQGWGEWLAASSFRAWLGNASKGLCATAQSCVQFPPLHLTTCPGFKGLNWVERPKGAPLHSSSLSQCDSWKMSNYFKFSLFQVTVQRIDSCHLLLKYFRSKTAYQ